MDSYKTIIFLIDSYIIKEERITRYTVLIIILDKL